VFFRLFRQRSITRTILPADSRYYTQTPGAELAQERSHLFGHLPGKGRQLPPSPFPLYTLDPSRYCKERFCLIILSYCREAKTLSVLDLARRQSRGERRKKKTNRAVCRLGYAQTSAFYKRVKNQVFLHSTINHFSRLVARLLSARVLRVCCVMQK
jgi:hypothetical protein